VDNRKKEELIADFCKLESFQLENKNVASQKEYAAFYKEFKRNMKFTMDYLNQLYSSKYAQHFFRDDHINNQIEKWKE
jgi:hypothetical protein